MNRKIRRASPVARTVRLAAAAGFGLIELMIGILIGVILLLGLAQVFSTTRNTYQSTEGLARAQEDIRFALDYMQRDLRMAGYQGCVNDVSHFQSTPPEFFSHFLTTADRNALNWGNAPFGEQFNTAISGYEYTNSAPGGAFTLTNPLVMGGAGAWTPALPAELAGLVVTGSDVVVVRTFDTSSMPVTAIDISANPAPITVLPGAPMNYQNQIKAGSLYGIADCNKASVFQANSNANAAGTFTITNAAPQGLNLTGFQGGENYIVNASAKGLQLYPLRSVAYYIGKNASGGPALMRMNFSNGCTGQGGANPCVPEELVDGIENMQIMYGYDNHGGGQPDGGIDTYWTAAQVVNLGLAALGSTDAAWRRISSVRIAFISRSLDEAQTNNEIAGIGTINVLGVTVTPPAQFDGRLREVYTTTVALRNQLFGN